jgi:hypothetical protein
MKFPPGLFGLTFFVSMFVLFDHAALLFAEAAARQDTLPGLEMIATNGDGHDEQNVSRNGRLPLVLVRPNQAIPITLRFASEKAGLPVAAEPLDGGEVNRERLVILPTGKVIFTFKPNATPGRYRLLVRTPVEQHLLEFYVVDPNNPIRKPGGGRN